MERGTPHTCASRSPASTPAPSLAQRRQAHDSPAPRLVHRQAFAAAHSSSLARAFRAQPCAGIPRAQLGSPSSPSQHTLHASAFAQLTALAASKQPPPIQRNSVRALDRAAPPWPAPQGAAAAAATTTSSTHPAGLPRVTHILAATITKNKSQLPGGHKQQAGASGVAGARIRGFGSRGTHVCARTSSMQKARQGPWHHVHTHTAARSPHGVRAAAAGSAALRNTGAGATAHRYTSTYNTASTQACRRSSETRTWRLRSRPRTIGPRIVCRRLRLRRDARGRARCRPRRATHAATAA